MRRLLLGVIFLFWLMPAMARVPDAWLQNGCINSFGENWRLTHDDEAEALAKELLAKANLDAIPIVCSDSTNPLDLAGSYMWPYGKEKYFFIQLNGNFRLAIGKELRGVIAHEVGHYVHPISCNALLRAGQSEKFLICEHEVDMAGEKLAGVGAVVNMLKWTEQYSSQFTRSYGRNSEFQWNLRRRILLAEQEAKKTH